MDWVKHTLYFLLLFHGMNVCAGELTIALVSDGQGARENIPPEQLKSEIRTLLQPSYQLTFVELHGGWTERGVNKALRDALSDDSIDMVITEGLVGTHIAGKLETLSKPLIGTFVPEPRLQGLPLAKDKSSGKNNYVYISDLQSFDKSMTNVLSILPTKNFLLIADELVANGVPMLANPDFYGDYDVTMLTAGDSVDQLIERMPTEIEAVLLAPLPRFDRDAIRRLADVFIDRGLPSISFAGGFGVRDGILLSVESDRTDTLKYARRIALNILAVLEGTNASNLPVKMQFGTNLQYNINTAEALGFELPWEISLTAQAHSDEQATKLKNRNGMSLNDAVNLGLDRNLNLALQRLAFDIASDDVSIARSTWWPQLTLSSQITRLDEDITAIANPERSVDASLGMSQLIYSESAKANLDIAKLNREFSRRQLDTVILDTIQSVSNAYFSVLRSRELEKVQRLNLSVSVKNLELAENRFTLGAVTESDVLRWKSQIATDKRNLLSAQATVRNSIVALQNLLHQSFESNVYFNESDTQRLIELSLNARIRKIFDNPSERNLMRSYLLNNAVENAPELKQIELANAIGARTTKAAKRAFYVPNVSLSAQGNSNIDRSGLFSAETDAVLVDESWSIGVAASFPIFQGRKRHADLAKALKQQRQTELNGYLVEDGIRANALTQWNAIGSSYPAIFLSREAAQAAQRTLEMIRDQYSSGAINITTLIDAQNAALSAAIAATEAQYTYLIDYVNLSRAVADFRTITESGDGNSWLREFEEYVSKEAK